MQVLSRDKLLARMPRNANRNRITHAVLSLRELILSGEFEPGERLSELPLVARLGVSRTPVRLALAALEHEGLLRRLAAGGYVVREFSEADIRDAIELRGVLEGTAARFAAERGTSAADRRALRAINEQIAELVHRADYESFERYLQLNGRFHDRLVKVAGSAILERSLRSVEALPFASPNAMVLAHAELRDSRDILIVAHRQHDALIDAIERHQGARAESLAREHALLAATNLEIAAQHRELVLSRVPGASLVALDGDGHHPPPPAAATAPSSSQPSH